MNIKSPYDIITEVAGRDKTEELLQALEDNGWVIVPQPRSPKCDCRVCLGEW